MTRNPELADARKTAKAYVSEQVKNFSARVPKRDVSRAVNKITEVLAEIRSAYSAHRRVASK